MSHSAKPPPTGDIYSKTNDRSAMVPMTWSHLPCAPVYNTKTPDASRLGFTRHSGKMPNSAFTAYVASKPKRGNRDS